MIKRLLCHVFGHRCFTKRVVNSLIKEVGCKRCGAVWTIYAIVKDPDAYAIDEIEKGA